MLLPDELPLLEELPLLALLDELLPPREDALVELEPEPELPSSLAELLDPAPRAPFCCWSVAFTISCLASELLVPGLVRLIFILSPLSSVAWWSMDIFALDLPLEELELLPLPLPLLPPCELGGPPAFVLLLLPLPLPLFPALLPEPLPPVPLLLLLLLLVLLPPLPLPVCEDMPPAENLEFCCPLPATVAAAAPADEDTRLPPLENPANVEDDNVLPAPAPAAPFAFPLPLPDPLRDLELLFSGLGLFS